MNLHFQIVGVFLVVCTSVRATDPPNIVFFIADDMGWNDVGFNGGDVRTPNLDALAGHGIVIHRHYSLPSCSPSRTALLTSRYPIRSGMQGKPLPAGVPRSLPLTEKIFPEYFRDLGYKSHLVGKWHLGYETSDHLPTRRGFDTFFGFLNGFLSYYDGVHTHLGLNGRDFRRNEEGAALDVYGKYLTDVLTEQAISVIENHPGYGGLLLFLTYSAPHTGNLDLQREAPPNIPRNATGRQILKGMVGKLDEGVGKVVSALERNGKLNNTIIVFLSDNGAPTVDNLYNYINYGSNWPLRGVKLSNREGGIRTPSFIWSTQFKENPRVSHQLFHITDWLPTLYSAAGGDSATLLNSLELDGVDQWYSLVNSSSSPRSELLVDINDILQTESYIINNWKIVKDPPPDSETAFASGFSGESGRDAPYDELDVTTSTVGKILGKPKVPYSTLRTNTALKEQCNDTETILQQDCYNKYCLYNLQDDPTECNNLADNNRDIVNQLISRIEEYRKVVVPAVKYIFDNRSDPKYWNDYWSPWMEPSSTGTTNSYSFLILLPVCFMLIRSH